MLDVRHVPASLNKRAIPGSYQRPTQRRRFVIVELARAANYSTSATATASTQFAILICYIVKKTYMAKAWKALRRHRTSLHSLALYSTDYHYNLIESLVDFTAMEARRGFRPRIWSCMALETLPMPMQGSHSYMYIRTSTKVIQSNILLILVNIIKGYLA